MSRLPPRSTRPDTPCPYTTLFRSLANCGHLVSYGQASGPIGSWDVGSLQSNSATLSRPNYGHYTDTPEKVAAITERLFKALADGVVTPEVRSEEHTSELQSLMRISYAVFCLKKKTENILKRQ